MKNKLKVSEIFQSVQGEGRYVGENVVFLRLSGCTLSCKWCDTKYHSKGEWMDINDVLAKINSYNSNTLVITGGEPLLQQKNLALLLALVDIFVIIETNGTIIPSKDMLLFADHFSCSPKLHSSKNDIDKRINIDALETINSTDCIFKFVICSETDLKEMKKIIKKVSIPKCRVYLMKEGATKKKQYKDIKKFIDLCLKEGYNFSPRLHVMIWNNKKGV